MINQEIYLRDPTLHKLANDGVAHVNDQANAILRNELETFVCEGEYARGLEHILETFLNNIEQPKQPGVWISGFFGSGKSHMVKMLRAFWVDTHFEDGATARGIAQLPTNIITLLKELSTQAKRYGGLHAASGTLEASPSGSVRLALLSIIFKSINLPEKYPFARFVMWLKHEGIYETVRHTVEQSGLNWEEELANFYVAEELHKALVKAKPNIFPTQSACAEILKNFYPNVQDVSSEEMVKAIRQALNKDGKFPLTLVALDEIQQFIGSDTQRSLDVQEVVEACSESFGGKLLFLGTGQTAITGTSNLRKLEGRFTVRVELSDTDVDAVIRKVILAKKPSAIDPLKKIMQTNIGEISRHLSGTTLAHKQEDFNYFVQDYPILPVRRRFWESIFSVLDPTASQLRNQLSMVHKAIQSNITKRIGNVIPADYLYFDSADKMQQFRVLPRNVYEKTKSWKNDPSEDKRLLARACGLIFLINKLESSNREIGIKANVDTIADLMVEDLNEGSSSLRNKLPGLLDGCKELIIKVRDEYRIQTAQSAEWSNEFQNQRAALINESSHRIESERDDRIRSHFSKLVKTLQINQGNSNVPREIHPTFDPQLPTDSDKKVYVWIRDGWSIDDASVLADARQARDQSPTIFIFIPKRSADDLRQNIIDYKAANATIEKKGLPDNAEGKEAYAAIETIRRTADSKIEELLDDVFSGARVYQGGGNEIPGSNLQEMILDASEKSFQRLYPQFDTADDAGWGAVYIKAKQGSPDALKTVHFDGEPAKNPVCKAILGYIAGGKKGTEIRTYFEDPPYGWSRDAVDGGIQVLLICNLILAQDERGQIVDPKDLERKAIGKATFKIESILVTTDQRLQIRKLLQHVGIATKPGEELANTESFVEKMEELATNAGGEAPKPAQPDRSIINEIRQTAGNEQLLAIYNRFEELTKKYDEWTTLAANIQNRWESWLILKELLQYTDDIKESEATKQQATAIEEHRLLLAEPDLISPLIRPLEDALRKEITQYNKRYTIEFTNQNQSLERDSSWKEIPQTTQEEIKEKCNITEIDEITIGTRDELINELKQYPLRSWNDRIDALAGRFERARELAATELEPKTQMVKIPRRTLKTEEDIESWLEEVREKLKAALNKGQVVIQ
jgi:FtsZ-binding cell division protein ZapB